MMVEGRREVTVGSVMLLGAPVVSWRHPFPHPITFSGGDVFLVFFLGGARRSPFGATSARTSTADDTAGTAQPTYPELCKSVERNERDQ